MGDLKHQYNKCKGNQITDKLEYHIGKKLCYNDLHFMNRRDIASCTNGGEISLVIEGNIQSGKAGKEACHSHQIVKVLCISIGIMFV